MKQGSDNKQSLELRVLKNFPDPDLLMEYFWASKNNPFHMIEDEKLLDKDKDVDYLPAWSLGKMIEGLPADLMFCEDDDDEGGDTYELFFAAPSGIKLAEVFYKNSSKGDVIYKTEALELVDAVFKMIMKLKEEGWYE
jgi:hypothetical protein